MWVMGMLMLWSLVINIFAVVGFAFILSSLMAIPIWVAAMIGILFIIFTIPLIVFTDLLGEM